MLNYIHMPCVVSANFELYIIVNLIKGVDYVIHMTIFYNRRQH